MLSLKPRGAAPAVQASAPAQRASAFTARRQAPVNGRNAHICDASSGAAAPTVLSAAPVVLESDPAGLLRVQFYERGWNFWRWQGRRIHYIEAKAVNRAAPAGPPVVLVHGYGASAYHWRYTIPALQVSIVLYK